MMGTNVELVNDGEGNIKTESYYEVEIIDVLKEYEDDYYEKNGFHEFKEIEELLYKTTSLKDGEKEFNLLKEIEPYSIWKYNDDIRKYNL